MRAALVLLMLAGFAPVAGAQESARAVVERAVVAHGGMEKLSRARADKARMRGVIYIDKSAVPFTSELTVQLPQKYRSVVQMRVGERISTVVHELDGDRVSITI